MEVEVFLDSSIEKNENEISPYAADLLPTGEAELECNPEFWNKSENIDRANCYAYVILADLQ